MADENLSFTIVFDEAQKLSADVQRAGEAFGSLGDQGRRAADGISMAGVAAVEAAESLLRIETAADAASAAVQEISQPQELEIESTSIDEAVGKAEALRAEVDTLSDPVVAEVDASGYDAAANAVDNAKDKLEEFADANVKAQASAQTSGAAISGSFAKIGTTLATIGKAAAGSFLGFAAFESFQKIGQTISSTMKTAVSEFVEAERASVRLGSALASVGQFSGQAMDDIRAFADEIHRTTTFEDDAVVSAAALIAQVGRLSGGALQRATEAAVQLSAVLGRDLSASALLVARAAAGSTEALSRYGIVIDKTLPDSEKFAAVLEQIATNFGGRAQADAETFGGKIDNLKKSWNELLESFGRSLTVFTPVISLLSRALDKANDLLGIETPKSAQDAVASLGGLATTMRGVIELQEEFAAAQKKGTQGGVLGINPVEARRFETQIAHAIADAQKMADENFIAIRTSVVSGTDDQVADTLRGIATIRKLADETGSAALRSLALELEFVAVAAQNARVIRLDVEGSEKAKQEIGFILGLIRDLQESAGVGTDLEIIKTENLRNQVKTVEELAPLFQSALASMTEAVDRAFVEGDKSPSAIAGKTFAAFDKARLDFIASYGELPQQLQAIYDDAINTITAKAGTKPLPVTVQPIEVPVVFRANDFTNPLRQVETSAEEAKAALDRIGEFRPNLETDLQAVSESALGFQGAMVSGFESAFSAMILQGQSFKDTMIQIFKTLVDEAIKQLARLAALKIFTTLLGLIPGGAPIAAAVELAVPSLPKGATPPKKAEPVELPLIPVLPTVPIVIPPALLGIEFAPFIVPSVEIPTSVSAFDIPSFEPQQIDFAASRFQGPAFDFESSALAFSRAVNAPRALEAPRREIPPIRELLPRPVNISITGAVNDGISVRRQLTSGALRSELERSLRRGNF